MEFAGAGWTCFGAGTIAAGRSRPGESNSKSRHESGRESTSDSRRKWKLGRRPILQSSCSYRSSGS
jgi:hypothetical protein